MTAVRAGFRFVSLLPLLIAAGAIASDAETVTRKALVLEVGLVHVSPHRPGTDKLWDEAVEQLKKDACYVWQRTPDVGNALVTATKSPLGQAQGQPTRVR